MHSPVLLVDLSGKLFHEFMDKVVNGKVILIPQFGGIKQVVAEETDKENKPAVICLPPLGEYLAKNGRAEDVR